MSERTVQLLEQHPDRIAAAIETIAGAFAADPTWAPLLVPEAGNLTHSTAYWGLFVRSAQRYPLTFAVPRERAVSVWFPPGGEELTPDETAGFDAFATDLLGAATRDEIVRIGERFEAAHPSEPHYYLSLLATHPEARGSGLGMHVLAENLVHFDALGEPTYLESSNPANDHRYERLGYQPHGTIELPSGLTLTTFWRDPQPIAR